MIFKIYKNRNRRRRRMKVLELFAGRRIVSDAFQRAGHETYAVDWDKNLERMDLYIDIEQLTAEQIIKDFGRPDVIWASPDCTTYSIAAISRHRTKSPETGELEPKSEYAKKCDRTNKHMLELIDELEPKYYFIENPRGAMRKMPFMREREVHDNVLPIRREKDEANRHLDEPS